MQKKKLSRAHEMLSRGNKIASCGNEMLSPSRAHEIIFFYACPFAGSVQSEWRMQV